MAKHLKIAGDPEIDPTLPKTEIKLGGKSYFLSFSYKALALAEAKLRAQKVECNLLHALDLSSLDATRLVPLLYAALISHQPKIDILEVADLVTMKNINDIFDGIIKAYGASLAEPDGGDEKAGPQSAGVTPASNEIWLRLWSVARYDLGLSADEFYELTPRQFSALVKRHNSRTASTEFMFGQLTSWVANTGFTRPEKPTKATDFMPSEWMKKAKDKSPDDPKRAVRMTKKRRRDLAHSLNSVLMQMAIRK